MALRIEQIINVTLDDAPTAITGTHNFAGRTPRRVSLYTDVVKTNAPTSVTFTVSLSPDEGSTLVVYEKLIDLSGVDSPVANWALTSTGSEVVSLSMEDVVNYISVTATGSGTTSGATFAVKLWIVYEF